MERLELTAAPGDSGRLDAWLAGQCPTLSRSALQNLIEQGLVTCGGAPVNKKDKVAPGKIYAIDLPDPQPIEARPQNIPLDIVYEDDDLLVLNKPAGVAMHPKSGDASAPSLAAMLTSYLGEGSVPHFMSRLDKGTSGLLIAAKNGYVHDRLRRALHSSDLRREYRAVAVSYTHLTLPTKLEV